ncbi:MAG: single-stranded DNA-binding protein [Oscillospiraceae bacterium]
MTTRTNGKNQVELWGTAAEAPVFSHENHGEAFYQFPLTVPRLSGQSDCLQILVPAALGAEVTAGLPLRVQGQLRSFNNKSGQGNRLVITVFAQTLTPGDDAVCNRALLTGVVCKPPIFRRTPLGRNICDLMLAINRRYGRADYLPCIAWGQLALETGTMAVGEPLSLEGRVQSRGYTKVTETGTEERVAYEVSVMQLLPLSEG